MGVACGRTAPHGAHPPSFLSLHIARYLSSRLLARQHQGQQRGRVRTPHLSPGPWACGPQHTPLRATSQWGVQACGVTYSPQAAEAPTGPGWQLPVLPWSPHPKAARGQGSAPKPLQESTAATSASTPAGLLQQVLRAPAPRSALTRAGGTEPTPRRTAEVTSQRPSPPAPPAPPAPGTGPAFCAAAVCPSHAVCPATRCASAMQCASATQCVPATQCAPATRCAPATPGYPSPPLSAAPSALLAE